jgi:hypothetical protein
MDKGLLDYLNGDKNAVRVQVDISRGTTEDGREHIIITLPEVTEPLYEFWQIPKVKKAKDPNNPRSMGGKKPYVMLMIENLDKVVEQGMPLEYCGYLVGLSKNINWNTGLVKKKRSKNAFKFEQLTETWKVNERRGREIIKTLKQYNLLSQDDDGYKVSADFMRKGGKKNA